MLQTKKNFTKHLVTKNKTSRPSGLSGAKHLPSCSHSGFAKHYSHGTESVAIKHFGSGTGKTALVTVLKVIEVKIHIFF